MSKTKTVGSRIDDELFARYQAAAAALKLSKGRLVEICIEAHLPELEKRLEAVKAAAANYAQILRTDPVTDSAVEDHQEGHQSGRRLGEGRGGHQ